MKVYIVPGYNSSQGEKTVDRLIPILHSKKCEVVDVSYAGAQSGAISSLYLTKSEQNERTGHELAAKIASETDQVIIVAHSNGVAITSYIVEKLVAWGLGHRITAAIVIHGALTRGYNWDCYAINFFGDDQVLTVGARARSAWSHTKCFFKRRFGRECTGSRWGDYGAHYDHTSRNVKNIRTEPGHSVIFKSDDGLNHIVEEIMRFYAILE